MATPRILLRRDTRGGNFVDFNIAGRLPGLSACAFVIPAARTLRRPACSQAAFSRMNARRWAVEADSQYWSSGLFSVIPFFTIAAHQPSCRYFFDLSMRCHVVPLTIPSLRSLNRRLESFLGAARSFCSIFNPPSPNNASANRTIAFADLLFDPPSRQCQAESCQPPSL